MTIEDPETNSESDFSGLIGRRPLIRILRLTQAVYAAIRSHGEGTYPRECCGVLLGQPGTEGWQAEESVRASNIRIDAPHKGYQIAPAELVKIVREARRRSLDVAGFYHSHPDDSAEWSATDLAEAHWLGCSYVITAVTQGKATATNSFLLAGLNEEDKRFQRETILLT